MSLPSFLQHLDMLEEAGLVKSRKAGRVRTYRLTPQPLKVAEGWLEKQRAIWNRRLDQFDRYVTDLNEKKL
jgi:DNA-binding transcriptional ArsR family regulator